MGKKKAASDTGPSAKSVDCLHLSAYIDRVIPVFDSQRISPLVRVQQGEGTLGKLTKDQALYDQMTATLDRLDKLVTSIDRGDGTLGRLIHRETLAQQTEALLIEMRTLIKDVQENPKKYFKVSVF